MTITSRDLTANAVKYYEEHLKPEDEFPGSRWPSIAGIMSAQAAQMIREAAHLKVEDTDSIGIIGYTIMIYENSLASRVKGSIQFTHHQYKALLRQMVVDWADEEPKDWSAVDLGGLEEL